MGAAVQCMGRAWRKPRDAGVVMLVGAPYLEDRFKRMLPMHIRTSIRATCTTNRRDGYRAVGSKLLALAQQPTYADVLR